MTGKAFPPSRVPQYRFAGTLAEQERQLATNPLVLRMLAARREKAADPWRPVYHYVNPEYTLNDPNGLCYWQGRWHLFYQARPPEDTRQHWGHAVSDDLVHWRDLPMRSIPGRRTDAILAPRSLKRTGSSPSIMGSRSATWSP